VAAQAEVRDMAAQTGTDPMDTTDGTGTEPGPLPTDDDTAKYLYAVQCHAFAALYQGRDRTVLEVLGEITADDTGRGRHAPATSVWRTLRALVGQVLRGRGRWPFYVFVAFDAALPAATRDRMHEHSWVLGDLTVPSTPRQAKFLSVEIYPEAK
jgi:hypothetical protein